MATNKKKSILDLRKMKQEGIKLTWLTSYDYPTAAFAEQAGVEMILVGDSMGMCVYGYSGGTIPVTMDQCIVHTEAVRRAAPNTFVVGDMPFLSYQTTPAEAVVNAGRFHKEAGVDAVKLEGGRRVAGMIRAIADAGMVVCGHIGLTPQSSGQIGGFKAQGLTAESAQDLIKDARAVQEAGAAFLLLEAVPPEVGKFIAENLNIPVYGIGAGPDVDGQLLIVSDMLGIFQAFTPKFVKKYANLGQEIVHAMEEYVRDVKGAKFPEEKHCYRMVEGEYEKMVKVVERG
ncbi:MAG: 3-methyl-2-oxobutanoate hydroxymethyltransferase [Spirochaetales bacterium]|nr:3-methyl-2-oxobutanoate hydroxymethyltransferase [Spirochaetales bacterium]